MHCRTGVRLLVLFLLVGLYDAVLGQAPSRGVKTPGIQIPFTNLKSEMDWEAAGAEWIAVGAEAVLIANAAKDGLIRLDPKAKEKKAGEAIPGVKQACGGAVNAFGSWWTGACGESAVVRIDPKEWKATARVASGTGKARGGIAASADSVWALTDARGTLSRIDPHQNEVVAEFRVYADCGSLVFGEGSLWLACPASGKVLRVDPMTNMVSKAIAAEGRPEALAIGEGSVWVLREGDGKVERIDPKTDKVTKTIELGAPAAGGSIAVGEGSVWVSMPGFPLTRIDAGAEKVVQQFYGAGAGTVQAGAGSVWLVGGGSLRRFDPKRIAATLAE